MPPHRARPFVSMHASHTVCAVNIDTVTSARILALCLTRSPPRVSNPLSTHSSSVYSYCNNARVINRRARLINPR